MTFTFHGTELDQIPNGWPKKPPPGARQLCAAMWAFSPGSSREDVYLGWASLRQEKVFIWWKSPTLAELAPVRYRPYASGPLTDNERESFLACLSSGWRRELEEFEPTPPDQLFVESGYLTESDVSEAISMAWSVEPDEEDDEDYVPPPKGSKEVAIDELVKNIVWPVNDGGGGGAIGWSFRCAMRSRAAKAYALRYLDEHGKLPAGRHEIDVTVGPDGEIQNPLNTQQCGHYRRVIEYPTSVGPDEAKLE